MQSNVKQSYSIWQNEIFMFKKIWKYDSMTVFFMALSVPIGVLIPAIGVYMPKIIIDNLTKNTSVDKLLFIIGAFTAALIFTNVTSSYLKNAIDWRLMFIGMFIGDEYLVKTMDTDYENIESPKGQTMLQKAINAGYSGRGAPLYIFPLYTVTLLTDAANLILFGGILTSLNPLLIILLTASAIIRYIPFTFVSKYKKVHENKWTRLDKKLYYLQNKGSDFSNGKDVRLYQMASWFVDLYEKITNERVEWSKKLEDRYFITHIIGGLLTFLRDGIAYGYLIYIVFQNRIPAPDTVLFFLSIIAFSDRLNYLTNNYGYLSQANTGVCSARDYLDMTEHSNRNKGEQLPDTVSIKLENVSFTYPESEDKVLESFNLEIKAGEKLAIVGRNGAGKTTAIKLICGFYRPTEGRVLINGIDTDKFNYNEYFTLFTAVFQDIKVMPTSIAENVSSTNMNETDIEKVSHCLCLSGLEEKISSLPMGIDTPLVKGMEDASIELSGGEMQKLMLARALYKNSPVIILDEPTAALDPIAEHEIYTKYDELTKGRTSIYISHRLASTRFCDKIAYIGNGCVEEYGSHDELMQKCGKYAEMFEIQSHYYQKELKGKDIKEAGLI